MSRRGDLSRRGEVRQRNDMSQLSPRRDRAAARRPEPNTQPAGNAAEASAGAAGEASPAQIAESLQRSLASTEAGLRSFLSVLRDSGLVEAAQGYRALQMCLVQQKLWAHHHGRSELTAAFAGVASAAGELHKVFSTFTAVMAPLRELDKLVEPEEASSHRAP